MGEVVNLQNHLVEVGQDYRIEAEAVLKGAAEQKFERMLVIGRCDDGELHVAGTANAGESMILLEHAKHLIAFGKDPMEDD